MHIQPHSFATVPKIYKFTPCKDIGIDWIFFFFFFI